MKATIERIAALAVKLGHQHLADYGAVRSRHDFTQRQLMACLILRAYLKSTYRGLIDVLAGHGGLRQALGMTDTVPHYTTLQKFRARSQVSSVGSIPATAGRFKTSQCLNVSCPILPCDAMGLWMAASLAAP